MQERMVEGAQLSDFGIFQTMRGLIYHSKEFGSHNQQTVEPRPEILRST